MEEDLLAHRRERGDDRGAHLDGAAGAVGVVDDLLDPVECLVEVVGE